MPWLRRKILGGKSGPRNWFGDGSDGDIRIGAQGAEQSFDGGVTWATISTWLLIDKVVYIPSVQDGDVVVVNAQSLTVDAGYILTVANRCRGLLFYTQSNMANHGTITLTARGCHANPADAETTDDTPVASTDGQAVPEDGITIRRLAEGCTDSDTSANLMRGCGLAAVAAEANQPVVQGDGLVINIPRVGGSGGTAPTSGSPRTGRAGGTATNGTGGGGAGSGVRAAPGFGSAGTCFSGGVGGGGCQDVTADSGADYGGAGGTGRCADNSGGGGGAGNPAGVSKSPSKSAEDGTGALLLLIVGGDLLGSGTISNNGSKGGGHTVNTSGGGGSGGGVTVALYAGSNQFTGTIEAAGGLGGVGSATKITGAPGGDGSVIGPHKIDPRS